MIVPAGIEDMTDEEALSALEESGYDSEAAAFVLSVVKGEYEGEPVD